MSAPRLAIGADDFGLHEGVNAGCLQLAELGRIQAISCMVGGKAWRSGVPALRALDRDRVDLGLHLDLTAFPLASRPRRLPALTARSIARVLDRGALRLEIDVQLDAFEQALGRGPDHVDGHQHVHQLPQVREVLIEALLERSPRRPWLRNTRPPVTTGRLSKAGVVESLGAAALCRRAQAAGFAYNAHLLGVYGFDAAAPRYIALLQRWLALVRDGDLLVCHPSSPCSEADPIQAARAVEAQVLGSRAFARALADSGVHLQALGTMPGFDKETSSRAEATLNGSSPACDPAPSRTATASAAASAACRSGRPTA